jgi:16S rRNA (guanine966-N2)-methyltransferase
VWAGRSLVSPGRRVRATSEAVRRAWLDAMGAYLAGARVLDLFAGSGALGLEALSRGAASADFVESGEQALHALKANVAAFRLHPPRAGETPTPKRKAARIFKRDAIPFVGGLAADAYDVTFADPPYGSRKLDLVVSRWLEVPFARVLGVEHAAEQAVPAGGTRMDVGEVAVTVYGLQNDGAQRVAHPAQGRGRVPSTARRRPRGRST